MKCIKRMTTLFAILLFVLLCPTIGSPHEREELSEDEMDEIFQDLREDIQEFVADVVSEIEEAPDVAEEIEENDVTEGRTLRDVHGNLVRVEQHLLRPDPKIIQFVNITQRDGYQYKGKFRYTGPNTPRMDVLDAKVVFNTELPDEIIEWPEFLDREGDALEVEHTTLKIENRTPQELGLRWEGRRVSDDEFDVELHLRYDGEDHLAEEPEDIEIPDEVTEEGSLWVTQEIPIRIEVSGEKKLVWLRIEGYLIDSDGNILTESYFEENFDPLDILRDIALQSIISTAPKDYTPEGMEGNPSQCNPFEGGNIDLVVTPDTVLAIIDELGETIFEIMEEQSEE